MNLIETKVIKRDRSKLNDHVFVIWFVLVYSLIIKREQLIQGEPY